MLSSVIISKILFSQLPVARRTATTQELLTSLVFIQASFLSFLEDFLPRFIPESVNYWVPVCPNSRGQNLVFTFFLIGALEAVALIVDPSNGAHLNDKFDRGMRC